MYKKYLEIYQKELDIQRDFIVIDVLTHVYGDRLGTLMIELRVVITKKVKAAFVFK